MPYRLVCFLPLLVAVSCAEDASASAPLGAACGSEHAAEEMAARLRALEDEVTELRAREARREALVVVPGFL